MSFVKKNHLATRIRRLKSIAMCLSLIYLFLSSIPAYGQITIKGRITDAATGEGLPSANILVKNSYTGTASGLDGSYSLTVKPAAPFKIVFSFIGYRKHEVEVTSTSAQADIDVALEAQALGSNEIVITAQLREQELQEVPVSVIVLDKQSVARTHVLERPGLLTTSTPGLSGNDLGVSSSYLTIRGIGSSSFGIGLEASVGVFIDDIYAGRITALAAFLDVERFEVIKGPQNTLFGRNASAGIISAISNKPKNQKELGLSLGMGNEGQTEVQYVANYPLSKSLFARLAGRLSYRDGVRNVINFQNEEMGKLDLIANRISFLYQPDYNWSVQLSLEHQDDDGGGYGLYGINTDLGVTGNPFDREIELSTKIAENKKLFGARLQMDRLLSSTLHLKSLTGLRTNDSFVYVDADGSPTDVMIYIQPEKSTTVSQDFRLLGQNNKINWLIATGIFYEDIETTQSIVIDDAIWVGGMPIGENGLGFAHPAFAVGDSISDRLLGPLNAAAREDGLSNGEYLSYALYGDLTYALTEKLNVSAGMRYSIDNKKFTTSLPPGEGVTRTLFGDNLLGPNTGNGEIQDDKSWSGLQPRLAFDYTPQKGIMLYTSYARGYKAGGYNNITAISFDEETSNAYELGLKSSFGNGNYKFNVSGYFTDYANLQVQSIVNTIIAVSNAADVESKGIEIETSANFKSGLSIIANAAIGEARYKNYKIGEDNFSGNTPDRSPDNTFSLIAQYMKPIRGLGNLVVRADYGYQSKVYFDRSNRDDLSQDGYGLFNAYVALEKLWGNRLDVILYGYNLTDQNYLVHAEDAIGFTVTTIRNIPRLFGIKMRMHLAK
ncbi:MAG: TonB-dependent receptor [bacterium]